MDDIPTHCPTRLAASAGRRDTTAAHGLRRADDDFVIAGHLALPTDFEGYLPLRPRRAVRIVVIEAVELAALPASQRLPKF